MTDLEMTKLCAQAMGLYINSDGTVLIGHSHIPLYDPLHNDDQAMALVKRFNVYQAWDQRCRLWETEVWVTKPEPMGYRAWDAALNRAVVEAVAKMQVDRKETSNVARQNEQ